jgi:hypothetical protein
MEAPYCTCTVDIVHAVDTVFVFFSSSARFVYVVHMCYCLHIVQYIYVITLLWYILDRII